MGSPSTAAGVNTPAAGSPAPAKQTTGSRRLILGGAAAAVALVGVVAAVALWPRGVQSNSSAESAIEGTSSSTAASNRPAGVPTAASSSMTPPQSHLSPAPIPAKPPTAAVSIPSRSGSAFVITRSGKIACQIRADDVGCQVQWSVATPLQYGAPANGVRVSANGDSEWVTGDMGHQSYTTMTYGTRYRTLGWTVTPTSDGTTFSNDATGHGMTVGVQGVEPFERRGSVCAADDLADGTAGVTPRSAAELRKPARVQRPSSTTSEPRPACHPI